MKAIILAAGKGSRISDQIGSLPKSMLNINGKPLIRTTVEMILSLDIEPVLCVGYKAEIIKEALAGLSVTYINNPFFDITNNIVSLWLAREEINDDVILLSADVVFKREIIERLIRQKSPFTLAVDKSKALDGDFFFKLSEEGCVLDYGADLPPQMRDCENVGLAKINREFADVFRGRLNDMICEQKHQVYFENVFLSFIGDDIIKINTVDISDLMWFEIDFYNDYLRVLQQFNQEK